MIFSSFNFILLFFPVSWGGYVLLNHLRFNNIAKLWLVIASFFFYSQGSPDFFPFFLGSVFANYIVGSMLGNLSVNNQNNRERRLLLFIGILGNIGLLGYYKYTDFFITNYNYITNNHVELKHIVLPIGISFFTFQLIAFLVDAYRGECESYKVLDYLLFITFFPQLIVGPIIHHSEVIPQFKKKYIIKWSNISKGIYLFLIGCSKKIIFADVLTKHAQSFFDNISIDSQIGIAASWFYSIEYTVSYYFDLSSYADMAIGLGLLFNIVIPINFNSPYKARNFQDYWRRWHMTLSRFLGDYVFKSVYKKNDKWRTYYVATMITFFVSGFWHGAGWTFVVWGIINGLFVCCASYMNRKKWKLPAIVAYPITALGIIFTRVLFISPTFKFAKTIYRGMIGAYTQSFSFADLFEQIKNIVINNRLESVILLLGIIVCWFFPNSNKMVEEFKPTGFNLLFVFVLAIICFFNMNHATTFLYFQF